MEKDGLVDAIESLRKEVDALSGALVRMKEADLESTAKLNAEVDHLKERVNENYKSIQGNGREGLTAAVTRIEERVSLLKEALDSTQKKLEGLIASSGKKLEDRESSPATAIIEGKVKIFLAIISLVAGVVAIVLPALLDLPSRQNVPPQVEQGNDQEQTNDSPRSSQYNDLRLAFFDSGNAIEADSITLLGAKHYRLQSEYFSRSRL
jgi:hypothetical protein